jgi:hypothetical protein
MVCLTSQRSWLAITRSKIQLHYSHSRPSAIFKAADSDIFWLHSTLPDKVFKNSATLSHKQNNVLSTVVVLFIYKNMLHSSEQYYMKFKFLPTPMS